MKMFQQCFFFRILSNVNKNNVKYLGQRFRSRKSENDFVVPIPDVGMMSDRERLIYIFVIAKSEIPQNSNIL